MHRAFERAVAAVGTDYKSTEVWDNYLAFEMSKEQYNNVSALFARVIRWVRTWNGDADWLCAASGVCICAFSAWPARGLSMLTDWYAIVLVRMVCMWYSGRLLVNATHTWPAGFTTKSTNRKPGGVL